MNNRVIKFRAWDGCEMHTSYMIGRPQLADALSIMTDEEFAKDIYGLSEWKVMQFTGLTDKNGKEIYEGDILKDIIDERLYNWIVLFKNGCFGIQNIGVDGHLGDFFAINSPYFFEDREIIGNVFSNSELLKP